MSNVEIIRHGDRDPWERGYSDGKVVTESKGRNQGMITRTIRETTRMYAYFVIYRDLGPIDRSFRAVGEKTKRSLPYITKMAAHFDWTTRCEAWDGMQERRKRETQQQAIDEMNDRQARMAMIMFSTIAKRLVGSDEEGVRAIDPNTLGPKDIARLAEVATKIERVARGTEDEAKSKDLDGVRIRVAFDISPSFPAAGEAGSIEPPRVEPRELTGGTP